MKRQIRQGIFESNSSSSHVICVTKDDHILTQGDIVTSYDDYQEDDSKELLYVKKDGEWDVWGELYFGRGFQVMSSLEDKTRYAIAEFCGNYTGNSDEIKKEYLDEILNILNSVIPKLTGIHLHKKYVDIYEDLEGNELPDEEVLTNWDVSKQSAMRHFYKRDGKIHPAKRTEYCYEIPDVEGIDHQSRGLLTQFLKTEGISLEEFLLNKKYVIIEDSDETCLFKELKRSGLFNKDNIVKEYTAWQAYQDSGKTDPEYQEWLDEQKDLKEGRNDEETD